MKTFERGQSTSQRTSTVDGGQDAVGAPGEVTLRQLRRARLWRRIGLLLLAALLVLGALNFLGVRMAKTSASGGGYQLQVS
jgi:hypothetical protein